jgi:hypothetical protein
MRFKEFLLKEQEDNSLELKITDILTSLQNMIEDSAVLTPKDINDNLVSMVRNKIKPLMNSGKNRKALVLQKVAVNIELNAEKGDDPRPAPKGNGLMLNCKAELESLLSGVPINKINKKQTEGLPKPQDSIKNDLKNSSKVLKQADQPNPGMETGVDNNNAPPLSGDGQRTLNVL